MYSEEYFLERQIELEIEALKIQKAQIDLRLKALDQNWQVLMTKKVLVPKDNEKAEDSESKFLK